MTASRRSDFELDQGLSAFLEFIKAQFPAHALLSELLEIGVRNHFLQGFVSTTGDHFLKRLKTAPEAKQALAAYAVRTLLAETLQAWQLDPPACAVEKTIFFESGSTIAYLIGEVARAIAAISEKHRPLPCCVKTNNLLALTAFPTLIRDVQPVPGTFSPKYFGFLPFYEQNPDNEDETKWHRELQNYSYLEELVHGCDTVFATCSNFSLLAGPLVGDRANALTKHAIHSAKPSHMRLIEAFHFEKLIPLREGPPSFRMNKPTTKCHSVFVPPGNGVRFSQVRDRLGEWHAEFFEGHVNSSPITKLAERAKKLVLPLRGADAHWIQRGPGTEIIIGLPLEPTKRTAAVRWMEEHRKTINDILKDLGFPWRYGWKNFATSESDGVVHLRYDRHFEGVG